MDGKQIVAGPGGRSLIREPGQPDRVALPMHCAVDALDPEDRAYLERFFEAAMMSWGRMDVAMYEDEPRGRYARFSHRVSLSVYAAHEVEACRWIQKHVLGEKSRRFAEIFVRLEAEDVKTFDFIQFGALLINTDNPDMARGAAIGALRVHAAQLKDAYRIHAQYMAVQEQAANKARAAVASHRPNLLDRRGG
jgi:hypothetical protein